MSRGKARGNTGRYGLFDNLGGDAELRENPLLNECPKDRGGCGAQPRQRCTRPGRGGRVSLHGYHPARTTPPSTPDTQETDRG